MQTQRETKKNTFCLYKIPTLNFSDEIIKQSFTLFHKSAGRATDIKSVTNDPDSFGPPLPLLPLHKSLGSVPDQRFLMARHGLQVVADGQTGVMSYKLLINVIAAVCPGRRERQPPLPARYARNGGRWTGPTKSVVLQTTLTGVA